MFLIFSIFSVDNLISYLPTKENVSKHFEMDTKYHTIVRCKNMSYAKSTFPTSNVSVVCMMIFFKSMKCLTDPN